jgi:hypothetical protein
MREKYKGFIYAGSLGLYGFIFVDFGKRHIILDADGEEEYAAIVQGITQDENGQVLLH